MASKCILGVGAYLVSSGTPTKSQGISSLKTIVLLFVSLISDGSGNAQPPRENVERLKADVYYFASDTLEGRGISTPGIEVAALHIRTEFKRLRLKSGTPDGSFYQSFEYGRPSPTPVTTLHNVIGVLEGKGEFASETIVIGCALRPPRLRADRLTGPGHATRSHSPRRRRQRVWDFGDA